MKLPLKITLHDIPQSGALETAIREKAAKLDQFYPHIMACRVTVDIPGKHKQQGNEFSVRVDLTVPGKEIVVDRDRHEDVYVAVRDAFDHARRQLEDFARRQRGEVKMHATPNRVEATPAQPEED
jgi:ribosomal subunit interface protein